MLKRMDKKIFTILAQTKFYLDLVDIMITFFLNNSKTCVKWTLSKRPKIGFQDQLLLSAGHKYFRMLQGEHSALLLTFIKLPFVTKIIACNISFQIYKQMREQTTIIMNGGKRIKIQ